jgi:hypothetical protein
MPISPVEKYFTEYIEEELPEAKVITFHKYLVQDPDCVDRLDELYQIHILLKEYQRPQPDKARLEEYHTQLKKQFCYPKNSNGNLINYLSLIIKNLIYTKSLWVRATETFALVLIGIFLGWILFYGGDDKQSIDAWESEYYSTHITNDDLNYIYYYFQASEIILLEMSNLNKAQTEEGYDIYLNKEIAQQLLKKTFSVHEIALQLNDIRMLRFLSKMEIILYDLSNMQEGEVDESLEGVKMVIQDGDLLEEAKRLQVIMEKTRFRAG